MLCKKNRGHSVLLCALFPITAVAQSHTLFENPQPAWNDQLSFEEIEKRLQTEAIVARKSIRFFLKRNHKSVHPTHPVDIVVLASGLKAVCKDDRACYGEVAAYRASKLLGLRLVPPTVFRDIHGKKYSLQFFVDASINIHTHTFKKIRKKDIADKNLFYYIFNQWDGHTGNQIISRHGNGYYLTLIDHGSITFTSHNTKLKSKVFSASTLVALQQLTKEALETMWAEYLLVKNERARTVIERTLQRKEHLLQVAKTHGKIIRS